MSQVIFEQIIGQSLAQPLPQLTRRDAVWPDLPKKIQAITGMRRAGKTSFLQQTMADFLNRGVPREGLLYLNFEDERLLGLEGRDLGGLIEAYYRLCPQRRGSEETLMCLDEIQLISGWETFVRRLLDTENVRLFVSGSSSKMLSREVASALRGRALETVIWPFSFNEYLRHLGMESSARPGFWPARELSRLESAFGQYLREGGFPEAAGRPPMAQRQLLQSYVDACLFRDIVERHQVTNVGALRRLVRQLLCAPGNLFSIHKFWNDLKSQSIPVAKETLHQYLAHLEDAFLVFTVELDTSSERQRQVNPRKVYPVDPGLIPVYDRSGKANIGHALEVAVALELKRRGAELAYGRTQAGHEVDFVATMPDDTRYLIQVCAELDDADVREREFRPFAPDAKLLRPRRVGEKRMVLTASNAAALAAQRHAPAGVTVMSAWAWMLGQEPS